MTELKDPPKRLYFSSRFFARGLDPQLVVEKVQKVEDEEKAENRPFVNRLRQLLERLIQQDDEITSLDNYHILRSKLELSVIDNAKDKKNGFNKLHAIADYVLLNSIQEDPNIYRMSYLKLGPISVPIGYKHPILGKIIGYTHPIPKPTGVR